MLCQGAESVIGVGNFVKVGVGKCWKLRFEVGHFASDSATQYIVERFT